MIAKISLLVMALVSIASLVQAFRIIRKENNITAYFSLALSAVITSITGAALYLYFFKGEDYSILVAEVGLLLCVETYLNKRNEGTAERYEKWLAIGSVVVIAAVCIFSFWLKR